MATNLKQYIDLRTLLDSLEIGSLMFYLNDKGQMSPTEKYRYLKEMLMPVVDEVWHQIRATQPGGRKKKLSAEIECPPGYNACDGVCVPYNCPDLIGATVSARKKAKATKRKS